MGVTLKATCDLGATSVSTPIDDNDEEIDPIDGVPDGWVRILIERPMPNPVLERIQAAKRATVDGQIAMLRAQGATEEQIRANIAVYETAADGVYAAQESLTPPRIIERTSVLLDVRNADVAKVLDQVSELLQIAEEGDEDES